MEMKLDVRSTGYIAGNILCQQRSYMIIIIVWRYCHVHKLYDIEEV